jgi:hypothetical protein
MLSVAGVVVHGRQGVMRFCKAFVTALSQLCNHCLHY